MDIKELTQERRDIFNSVYEGKIPKRVPVNIFVSLEVIAEKYGLDLFEVQYNPLLLDGPSEDFCKVYYSDICPYKGALRWPTFYQQLGAQNFVMASNGFIQHPEIHCMEPEDYDDFIKDPLKTIITKCLPRQFKNLDMDDPMNLGMTMLKANWAQGDTFGGAGYTMSRLAEKYGYYTGDFGADAGTPTPFDFIADELRGFSQMSVDMRRYPEKVIDAVEAIYPLVFESNIPPVVNDHGHSGMMLHMLTFMRTKDFEKFYWPSFYKLLNDNASIGLHSYIFAEADCERYIPYFKELPVNTLIYFETGDPKHFKDELGSRHILMGNYPLTYLRNHTKEECIDKAKELIDILAPGGRYLFNYDKGAITINDFDIDNANAVNEFVRDYAVYDNPGEPTGEVFKKEDYKRMDNRKLTSEFIKTREQLKEEYPTATEYGLDKLEEYNRRAWMFLKGLVS